jgi:hypothetical protein
MNPLLLIFIFFVFFAALIPSAVYAHTTPSTMVFMDVNPGKVSLELQMPLPELELAFGNNISNDPQGLIKKFGPQLKEYLEAHTHAYNDRTKPWLVNVGKLRMDQGQYPENGISYWELNAVVELIPQQGESTRKFLLDYDVIMHQVINHAALVSVRTDWEAGRLDTNITEQAMAISRDMRDNLIHPLQINLEKGSWFNGFKSMLELGIDHIKEGTDHLFFLLTLLLPATLLVKDKKWNGFGGTRRSLRNIVKVVTAFTVGHSVTLIIGAMGIFHFPSRIIEMLIAASILISAIHALKPLFPGKEMLIAAGFGLIHGMAFAQTLTALNLDGLRMALSILGFNLGIELMQLFIIAITMPWLIVLSRNNAYTSLRIAGAVFAIIASVAWMIERISGQSNPVGSFIMNAAVYGKWIILLLAVLSLLSYFQFRKAKKTLQVM